MFYEMFGINFTINTFVCKWLR